MYVCIHNFYGPPHPPSQTAFRSPQPLLHNTRSLATEDRPSETQKDDETRPVRTRCLRYTVKISVYPRIFCGEFSHWKVGPRFILFRRFTDTNADGSPVVGDLDFLRPIIAAEAFEAVDWLADLPQQTWPQAGRSSDAILLNQQPQSWRRPCLLGIVRRLQLPRLARRL